MPLSSLHTPYPTSLSPIKLAPVIMQGSTYRIYSQDTDNPEEVFIFSFFLSKSVLRQYLEIGPNCFFLNPPLFTKSDYPLITRQLITTINDATWLFI
jgi:hypothetical protein